MDPIHRVVVEDYSDMPPLLPGTEVETTAATNEADTGAQSDASLPSLQTVSDSSDEDLESEDGDEDEDDYVSDDGESLGDEPPLLTRPIPFPGSSADLLGVGATAQARPRRPAQVSDFEVEEFRSAFVDSHISTNTMERAMRTAIDIRMLEHALTASDTRGIALAGELPNMIRNLPPQFIFDQIFGPPNMESDHDPVRADTITSRLEVIPEELIPRYEKLRSGAEDQFEGCAICRDAFIEEHFPELPSPKKGSTAAFLSELPFDKMRIPDILAFPCPGMHIFHENCIYPWLARKTTCPTCRFDVDPDSLTLRIHRNLRRPGERPRTRKPWEPPKGPAFLSWLERAEDKKNGLPVSPTPTPTLNAGSQDTTALRNLIFENDADDEDDDEEWITDEEDPHQYHTPFLVPMPPTPAELFESDSDDEGPPPLVGEDDDGLPPRPIPNRIQTPAQSRTPLVVPEVYEEYDDDNDSEYNTPPFVGEDSNRHAHPAPLRRSRSGEQRRIPQYTLWSELMTIFGDLPPFGPGGENSVYQAR